jgi:putative MATE family efflux protein
MFFWRADPARKNGGAQSLNRKEGTILAYKSARLARSLKRMFGSQDMTTGVIWRRLAAFSMPLLIGNVVQQLYSAADSVVVGRFVGDTALAAVGASLPLLNMLLILFMGVSTGTGIMVAQYYGARDRERLSKTVGSTLVLLLLTSAAIMAVGPLVTMPVLRLTNTPDSVIGPCAEYLSILFAGISGIAFYNGISGILRGVGDSASPLVFLLITCAMNIVLDVWFVAGLGWGVAGAAWATVISQWASSALCLWRLARMRGAIDLSIRLIRLDKALCLEIARLGLPAAMTQLVFSFANFVIQSLVNSFGDMVLTCCTIVTRVDGFAMMPNFTFSMAMSTFVGQNVGAGRLDRAERGTKACLAMGVSVSAAIVGLTMLLGRAMIGVFTGTGEVISLSYRMMCILTPGYVAVSVMQILSGAMRGAGDSVSPMWISIITTVAIRTPAAYLLAFLTRSDAYPVGRPEMLHVSMLIACVLGAGLSYALYRRGAWRGKRLVGL